MNNFKTSHLARAPQETVWNAWTDNDKLAKWFGPIGCPIFSSELDLNVGGFFHYGLQTPIGLPMWAKWTFREIKKPEKLVFTFTFSEPEGKLVTRHPWEPNWPLELHSTVTFADKGDKTGITIEWSPVNATDTERQVFENNLDSMKQGWLGTFQQLDEFLS